MGDLEVLDGKMRDLSSDLAFNEKLIEDMDSYWEDLSASLTVSRMVSKSVVKGIVNAVAEEAAEKIALKDAELDLLSDRLKFYESSVGRGDRLNCFLDGPNCFENLSKLRISAEEQLRRLKDEVKNIRSVDSANRGKELERVQEVDGCIDAVEILIGAIYDQIDGKYLSLEPSNTEGQCDDKLPNEVVNIIAEVQDEFEKWLLEQRARAKALNEKWQNNFNELSRMRQELDTISKSLLSSEPGLLSSQSSVDILEEWSNARRKDQIGRNLVGDHYVSSLSHLDEGCNSFTGKSEGSIKPMLDIADLPLLKCMTKEELIAYHKTEMTKMKRQHESALHEATEELFSLKRELLKEKGSNPSHFRKDKEFEQLRRKIPEFITRLDEMLLEDEILHIMFDDQDISDSFRERMAILSCKKNQCLQDILSEKRKDAQIFYAEQQMRHHSSVDTDLIKQIKKLKSDIEDLSIGATIVDELQKSALRQVVNDRLEDVEMENKIILKIYYTIFMESVCEIISSTHAAVDKFNTEKDYMVAVLVEKEMSLCSEIEDNNKLKQMTASLSELVKEKEKISSEATHKLIGQKEQLDQACQELCILRDLINMQEALISENKSESNLTRIKLEQTLQQMNNFECEKNKLNQNCKILSDALDEAEKQKNILNVIIQEREEMLTAAIGKEKEQTEHMKSIIFLMSEISKMIAEREWTFHCNIEKHESRLNTLNKQCNQLVQLANLSKREGLCQKQKYDIMCSDLQKAEIEVDLLGNEVDTLMSILEMIYIALDHYSNVLQYYPGVKEILEFLRRELKKRYQLLA